MQKLQTTGFTNTDHDRPFAFVEGQEGNPEATLSEFVGEINRALENMDKFNPDVPLTQEIFDQLKREFPRLSDITSSKRIKEISPHEGSPEYKYAPLMRHEVGNALGYTLSLFGTMETDLFYAQKPVDPDGKRHEKKFTEASKEIFTEYTIAAKNLLVIMRDGLANDGELENVGFDRLLSTLRLPKESAIKIELLGVDKLNISTVEEFLTIRTLVDNAIKAQGVHSIFINQIGGENGANDKVFVIIDDAPSIPGKEESLGSWDEKSKKLVNEKNLLGERNPEEVYVGDSGGRSIVSYRAGQERNLFVLGENKNIPMLRLNFPAEIDQNKLKFVGVGFKNKGGEKVAEAV